MLHYYERLFCRASKTLVFPFPPLSICLFCFCINLFCSGLIAQQVEQKLEVELISLIGNKKTKPDVILRELSFQEKDSLSLASLPGHFQRSQQNVYNLGLFGEVSFQHQVLDDKLYVFITVQERWYIFPRPQIRSEERNTYDVIQAVRNRDFSRFSYGLQVQWRNVTGRNEWIDFYGQLGFSERLSLSFLRPAIFNSRYTDLITSFRFIEQNEIIVSTIDGEAQWGRIDTNKLQTSYSLSLGIRQRFSIYTSLTATLNYRHFSYDPAIYSFNERFLTRAQPREYFPSLVLQFVEDKRDFRSFPLAGYRYQLMFRATGLEGLSSTQYVKLGGTWVHHLPLSRRWNLSYGVHNMITFGDRIPFFEKSAIGVSRGEFANISTNLRGYERFIIDGTYIHMSKVDLKFALIPYQFVHIKQIPFKKFQDMPLGLYISAHLDMGYIADESINNQDTFFKDQFLSGYGVGINLISLYDNLFRLEYSRNHLGQGGIYFHGTLAIK